MRVILWEMTCHIRAQDTSVTFKIMTERVMPRFVTLYYRWHRASGRHTDEVTHRAKIGGAYSHAEETRVIFLYQFEWYLQLER